MIKRNVIIGVSSLLLIILIILIVICINNCNVGYVNKKNTNSKITSSQNKKDKSATNNKKSSIEKNKKTNSSNSKKFYTVVFKDEKGKIISKQRVRNGKAAKLPKAPKKKGYYFHSWSKSSDKITNDVEITPVYIKEGNSPQIVLSKVIANPGDKNIKMDVSVKNNPGIASIALDVIYDKKHLKLTDFTYNTDALKGATTVPFNSEATPTCLSMINGTKDIKGDFTFATLYFDVMDNAKGSYPIVATYDDENVYNIDESNVHFELVNGLITVK